MRPRTGPARHRSSARRWHPLRRWDALRRWSSRRFGSLRRRHSLRGDDGAFLPMVGVMATALFVMVGLSVDGGGKMRAQMHADNVAAEAARAGGQAIDVSQAVAGTADVVDPALARAAALGYLHDAGVNGTATVSGNQREITVVVHITYDTKFLGLIGIDSWPETGTATAELVTR